MSNESKTNREIIDQLHTEAAIGKTELRPIKQGFEKGEFGAAEHLGSLEKPNRLKAEINALLALFIQEIWLKALNGIKEHPPGLIRASMPNVFLSESEIRYALSGSKSSKDVANFLMNSNKAFVQQMLVEWHKDKEERKYDYLADEPDIAPNLRAVAYDRYAKLLMLENEKDPYGQIRSGVLTAVNTLWGTIKVLPKVYENQFGQKMPIDEFEKLARNSLPMIYSVANSHLHLFANIEAEYTGGIQMYDSDQASDFIADKFHFRETDKAGLQIEIKPEVLSKVDALTLDEKDRTGCPAIYSIGPSHRNVIAEMDDWVIGLAKKYYLPALEKEQK